MESCQIFPGPSPGPVLKPQRKVNHREKRVAIVKVASFSRFRYRTRAASSSTGGHGRGYIESHVHSQETSQMRFPSPARHNLNGTAEKS